MSISYSSSQIAKEQDANNSRPVIVDNVTLHSEVDVSVSTKDIRNLARTFFANGFLHIWSLRCRGMNKHNANGHVARALKDQSPE